MKKYEVRTDRGEFKSIKDVKIGCCYTQEDSDPKILASFDTMEEAKEELQKYHSELWHRAGGIYEVTEYWVEENEYDEDGDFLTGGDAWYFSSGFTKEQLENFTEGTIYGV